MKTDERVIEAIFKGDSSAFSGFVNDNQELFFAYFRKHFPSSKNSLKDVFQEACIALWTQIVDGKMTRDKLQVDLSTYLVSIGRNKFLEETRSGIRIAKLNPRRASKGAKILALFPTSICGCLIRKLSNRSCCGRPFKNTSRYRKPAGIGITPIAYISCTPFPSAEGGT